MFLNTIEYIGINTEMNEKYTALPNYIQKTRKVEKTSSIELLQSRKYFTRCYPPQAQGRVELEAWNEEDRVDPLEVV